MAGWVVIVDMDWRSVALGGGGRSHALAEGVGN